MKVMIDDIKTAFLPLFPMFREERPDVQERLMEKAVCIRFSKGKAIYEDGAQCSGIGFLLSGEIRVFKISENGREITLYEIFPGETCILNASCLMSNNLYPANASALTDGVMMHIPAGEFLIFMQQSEIMRSFIFSLFNKRFCEIIELLEEVAFGRLSERLTEYIVEKSSNGLLRTSHQEIANNLGSSREVVSRLLKDLERRGVISLSRNLIKIVHM